MMNSIDTQESNAYDPPMPKGGKRAGAGRPNAGRIDFQIRLKPETAAAIQARAEAEGLDRGEYLEKLFGPNAPKHGTKAAPENKK